ncbi:hypothetical protein J2W47_004262 [Priestia megaterium]|nr:hypothetical protein [Priestia megaterium]
MSSFEDEEVLTGGNVSNVYRSGDTVRRELKSDSYKFHRLLKHLENKGFSYAPKSLGMDEKGREVLSFVLKAIGIIKRRLTKSLEMVGFIWGRWKDRSRRLFIYYGTL